MKRVLITGGAGFAGHHVVEHILKNTDWEIVIFDKLSYSSCGYDRLREIQAFDNKRVLIIGGDLSLPIEPGVAKEIGDVNYILHMGAETHVDNSISNPLPFVMSNVVGTMQILEFARFRDSLEQFVYFSTDEVFGSVQEGHSKEWDVYNSCNPYAATKAGGEELALAYANTYKIPVMITHTMNLFGERQYPEKFIPLVINRVLSGEKVYIHADQTCTIPGIRSYIHCRNMADAILFLLGNQVMRDKFNIAGECEIDNLELAKMVARIIGKPLNYELINFHSIRPGHDMRYALDGTKLAGMGWKPPIAFDNALQKTVEWTLDNRGWL